MKISATCLYCLSDRAETRSLALYHGDDPETAICCETIPHAPLAACLRDPEYVYCPCYDGEGTHPLGSPWECENDDDSRLIYCDEEQDEDNVCRHRGRHRPVAVLCGVCHGNEIASTIHPPDDFYLWTR